VLRRPLLFASFIAAAVAVAAAPSHAVQLSFDCITNNSATDCGIAESQLDVDISALGTTQARLTLTNTGPDAAVYTRVLTDGTILTAIAAIVDSPPAVDFNEVAPGVLPGGNGPPYNFTGDLEAAATNPAPSRGVGPSETLIIDFSIASGFDFDDVIAALTDGSLRIGVRVQSFASGGSEALINTPVPEAHTMALLALGLTGLGMFGRPRR
jgi:hypothetical protein